MVKIKSNVKQDAPTNLLHNWLSNRIPPHMYFVASAIFHYLGPSFAVLLFVRVSVDGVAWMHIVSAAVIFAIWRRPWRAWHKTNQKARLLIILLGVVFAVMNYSFYYAIDRLPLGTVAAIEFIGPILIALAGTKTWRNLGALALTATGVWLLTDIRIHGDPEAFFWAFANAACFAVYIIVAHELAKADTKTSAIDRLALAMIIAAVAITPLGLKGAIPALSDKVAIMAGIGVGLTSSVLPYVFDQLAMARLGRATYALFIALLPVTAVIIGVLVLQQIPSFVELLAIGLVVLGVLISKG